MKKIRSITSLILVIIPFVLFAQPLPYDGGINGGCGQYPAGGFGLNPVLHLKFTNPYVYHNGTNKVFAFDIELSSSLPDSYHNDLYISLSYNTLAFGPNIFMNNKIICKRLDLIPTPGIYSIDGAVDLATDRFAFHIKALTNNLTLLEKVPQLPQYGGLIHLEIDIADDSQLPGITFCEADMDANQKYINTGCPNPTLYGSLPGFENVYVNDLLTTDMDPPPAEWTWMTYIYEGDDALGSCGVNDINELEANGSIWGSVNYVSQIDAFSNNSMDALYYVKKDTKGNDSSTIHLDSHKIHTNIGNDMND
ncbi:MAG: hypothetical protein K8R53_00085 [Bacteroidales bacterium]|nr:hypothetical protein [Bacteroidales bacterium]